MRNRAFTLIELLVVIAILAILAAILFPVFASARVSAKKASGISNMKQVGVAMLLYTADHDDQYARNDECRQGSSLNPDLRNLPFDPRGAGCRTNPVVHRVFHVNWQNFVMPYTKSIAVFQHPLRGVVNSRTSNCTTGTWTGCGHITGSIALNLAITGYVLVNPTALNPVQHYRSWQGGSPSGLSNPSATMLFMETVTPGLSFINGTRAGASNANDVIYPYAMRESWNSDIDPAVTDGLPTYAGRGFILGMADGSTRFILPKRFLAETPTLREFAPGTPFAVPHSGALVSLNAPPNLTVDYPLWGLGAN